MIDRIKQMQELIEQLNQAGEQYYQKNTEIMTNYEYDQLYDQLVELEQQTGTVLADSPTNKVGYEVVSSLPKERHIQPMLSLQKTKQVDELIDFLGEKEGLLSLKLDGITIVLTYRKGRLDKAVTRGSGIEGEVVTNNAATFVNIPHTIAYQPELIIRGEAVILYSEFEKINQQLEPSQQYKNPRNLCSGSIRQLNSQVTAQRRVRFYPFQLVEAAGAERFLRKSEELNWLTELGFTVVESVVVTKDNLANQVQIYGGMVKNSDLGSDGLVLTYNEKAYSRSLGMTSKFPRDSIAFKWQDEIKPTTLRQILWSPSRTGLINPIAVFEPIELEGTVVQRASLHNVTIAKNLKLGLGDTITVYKANMIIPQIQANLTKTDLLPIPAQCPACGQPTALQNVNGVELLLCPNPDCPAKAIKAFTHFVSRDGMNIDGLSEATLEKLIGLGLVRQFSDLYHLDTESARLMITQLDGFGEKSYYNLIQAVEDSKQVRIANFINSLGIRNVGLSNAKLLVKAFDYDISAILEADIEKMLAIDGFGPIIADSLYQYFHNPQNRAEIQRLLDVIAFIPETKAEDSAIANKVFVITGSLVNYPNREQLKQVIEQNGGKVTGSVSAKTDYLINNDTTSTSSKNKKAQALQIPIITEQELIDLIGPKE